MLKSRRTIQIGSGKGVAVKIDTRALKPGAKLQSALDHLFAGGKAADLDPKDLLALGKKKSLIGKGENATFIRFDVKLVRIDERIPIDLAKLTKK